MILQTSANNAEGPPGVVDCDDEIFSISSQQDAVQGTAYSNGEDPHSDVGPPDCYADQKILRKTKWQKSDNGRKKWKKKGGRRHLQPDDI
ncbi:uncharacterized [Lates japonicus]